MGRHHPSQRHRHALHRRRQHNRDHRAILALWKRKPAARRREQPRLQRGPYFPFLLPPNTRNQQTNQREKQLQTDFPSSVSGKIALVSRGSCTFVTKSALAGKAGAVAAIVYNNIGGQLTSMTLGPDPSPLGPIVPTVGISRELGLDLVEKIAKGSTVTAKLSVKTFIEKAKT